MKKYIKIFREGDIFSKLSFLIWGLSNLRRKQIMKGIIFLFLEFTFIFYMATIGISYIADMVTLGTNTQGMVFNEATGIYDVVQGDNSMLILLYGVVSLVVAAFFLFFMWPLSIRSGEQARQLQSIGRKAPRRVSQSLCKPLN